MVIRKRHSKPINLIVKRSNEYEKTILTKNLRSFGTCSPLKLWKWLEVAESWSVMISIVHQVEFSKKEVYVKVDHKEILSVKIKVKKIFKKGKDTKNRNLPIRIRTKLRNKERSNIKSDYRLTRGQAWDIHLACALVTLDSRFVVSFMGSPSIA